MRKGFTLTEVLVVILIIGILAAVAVPQYRRVITRVRNREGITALRTIGKGVEMYNLANGPLPDGYSRDFSMLDVEVKPSAYWEYGYVCFDEYKSCGIYAGQRKEYGIGVKYYELELSVDNGVAKPYVKVLEGQLVSQTKQGEEIESNYTLGTAGADICRQAGGTMDEKLGCILR